MAGIETKVTRGDEMFKRVVGQRFYKLRERYHRD